MSSPPSTSHPTPPPLPLWLLSAKHHLLHHSPSIHHLRTQTTTLLHQKLISMNRLHPGGLSTLTSRERTHLIQSVSDEIAKQALYLDAMKEVERVIDHRLGSLGGGERRGEVLVKETERGVVGILARWPDMRTVLKGCMNVALPRELRRIAWQTSLMDENVRNDFQRYITSERFDRMWMAFSPILYDLCQAYLSSNKSILPLATQYRCVKRMEQSLMYLMEPSSCPDLRSLHLAFTTLELATCDAVLKSAGEETVAAEFGFMESGFLVGGRVVEEDESEVSLDCEESETDEEEDDYETVSTLSKPASTASSTPHTPRQRRHVPPRRLKPPTFHPPPTSTSRSRQLAILVPFIKALEMDSVPTKQSAVAADGYDGEGWMDDGSEEGKTGRVVEAVATFWARMPEHWRQNGEYRVQQIAMDVEADLQDTDFTLCNHILKLVGEGSDGHDFRGLEPLIRLILGDLFVGKCNLEVLLYIYDQLIIGSFEMNNDPTYPPFDTLIDWFCTGFLLAMRDRILQCEKVEYMYRMLPISQPGIPIATLSTLIDLRFLTRFRRGKVYAVHEVDEGMVLKMKEKMRRVEGKMVEGVGRGIAVSEVEEEDGGVEMRVLDEWDLVEAEREGMEEVERWMEVRRRYEEKRKWNMELWRQVGRGIIKWKYFVDMLVEAVNLRKEQGLKERANRKDKTTNSDPTSTLPVSSTLLPAIDPLTSIDDLDRSMILRTMWENLARDYEWTSNVGEIQPLMDEETRGSEREVVVEVPGMIGEESEGEEKRDVDSVEMAYRKSEWREVVKRPEMRVGTVLVHRGTVLGEETEHLTPLGNLLNSLVTKINYVLDGPPPTHPFTTRALTNAINDATLLISDVTIASRSPKWIHNAPPPPDIDPDANFAKQIDEVVGWVVERERGGGNRMERIEERREALLVDVEKRRKARQSGDGDGKVGVNVGRIYANQVVKNTDDVNHLKTMNGILTLIADRMSLVFKGDPLLHDTYHTTSQTDAIHFHTDERDTWFQMFGDTQPHTPDAILHLLSIADATSPTSLSRNTTLTRPRGSSMTLNSMKRQKTGLFSGMRRRRNASILSQSGSLGRSVETLESGMGRKQRRLRREFLKRMEGRRKGRFGRYVEEVGVLEGGEVGGFKIVEVDDD